MGDQNICWVLTHTEHKNVKCFKMWKLNAQIYDKYFITFLTVYDHLPNFCSISMCTVCENQYLSWVVQYVQTDKQ